MDKRIPKQAAIYVSATTCYGLAPEKQISYLEEMATQDGYSLLEVYMDAIFDTEHADYQKEFKRLVRDVKAGMIQRVFCISHTAISMDTVQNIITVKSLIAAAPASFSIYFAIEDMDSAKETFDMQFSFEATLMAEVAEKKKRVTSISQARTDTDSGAIIRAKTKHFYLTYYNASLFSERLVSKAEYRNMKDRIDIRLVEEISKASTNSPLSGDTGFPYPGGQELYELFSLLNA